MRSSSLRWKGSKIRSRRSRAFYMRPGGVYRPTRSGRFRTGGYYGRYSYGLGASPEMKFKDDTANFGTVDATGEIVDSICEVAQGTTESTRVGRKITIKKIALRWLALLPSTSDPTQTSETIRIIIYKDKQCNGATATVTDILEGANWRSFNNLANKGRFTVMMDKRITLNCASGAYDGTNDQFGECRRVGECYLDCNIPIEFDAGTGAITEIKSNNVGLLAIAADGIGTLSVFWRIRFFDA